MYDYITKFTATSYTATVREPKYIVLHHWGVDGQTFENVVNFFCAPGTQTSANYVVAAGKVACIVDPDYIAWHAGDWNGNVNGIGIECHPEMTGADFETVAELVADLRKAYGDLPIYPHSQFTQTACPGRWAAKLNDLSARANKILEGGTVAKALTVEQKVWAFSGNRPGGKGYTMWNRVVSIHETVMEILALLKAAQKAGKL